MIASISWRNVWRNKLRSTVIILAISAGLTGGVFTVAVYNGLADQKLRMAIDTQTGHLQVHAEGFQQNKDIRLHIAEPDHILEAVRDEPALQGISPRLVATAMAATTNANIGVQLNGVVPEREKDVTTVYKSVKEGDYFTGNKRNQVVISSRTAEKLDVGVGDKVIVTLQDINGDIVGAALRVSGIFHTAHAMFDEANMFVQKSDLERILSMPGKVNEVVIRLTDIEEVPGVQRRLDERFSSRDIVIESWREIQPELAYITDATWQINYLILIIILLALAFGILNTMLMAVFERVKEIGVLMAVGMSKWRIFMMIIMETIFLSLTGAAAGIALSAWVVSQTGQSGIDLSMFAEGLEAVGLSTTIYPQLDPGFYLALAGMVVVAALISSLYPAIKALQLKPVEAIHG